MIPFDTLAIDPSGCHLIEASAGTGKTYAIASLYLRLVIENEQCKPENILVVTFTEAATKELRDRIRTRLREAREAVDAAVVHDPFLRELMSAERASWPGNEAARARLDLALQTFDCATISTIHGFCRRALQENAFESGSLFDTELVTNQKELISRIVDDFWRLHFFAADAPLLPLAETRKWSPETFARFLKGKLTNPALRIVPAFTADERAQVRDACHHAYQNVCAQWESARADIEQILREHPGLSRNQKHYRDDVVGELSAGMDAFAAGGTPYAFFAGYAKLSAGYMKEHRLKKVEPPEHAFFTLWDELVDLVRKVAVSLHAELVECAQKRLPERKVALNVRFFDDLLADLHCALAGPGGDALAERMRGRYRAALIDEFQDTDQLQYKIFRKVFREGAIPLFLIGDPKQAIYSFRGADIYAYLEAREDVPEERRHTMAINWRSSAGLVAAVNQLFNLNGAHPLVIDGLSYPAVRTPEAAEHQQQSLCVGERDASPMQFWFFSRGEKEKSCIPHSRSYPAIVEAVTAEIAGLLEDAARGAVTIGAGTDQRAVLPGDIAVIVRGHKQAGLVYRSLQSRGIPAVVRSDQSVFRTSEARELRSILSAVAEPGREGNVRAALATSVLGVAAHDIAHTFAAAGEVEWEKRLDSFRQYHDVWKSFGFMTMFRSFLELEGVRARLLSLPGGERSITNLLHCGELLHERALTAHPGIDALCTWFSEQVTTPPESEEHQIRLESDEKAVKILTIHVSKGLEFPIVFCPFLWGGVSGTDETVVAHDGYEPVADFGSEQYDRHRRAALDEGLAENVRLLYVALTRAKYRCYVAWGCFRYAESSALAYLFHAPAKVAGSSSYEELVKVMEHLDDGAMIEKIRSLTPAGQIHLVVDPDVAHAARYAPATENAGQLQCRIMPGLIESDWRVASFSSLIDGHESPPEFPDHDSSDEAGQIAMEEEPRAHSFFTFPKGADPGTFLHSIFEQVDFASYDDRQLKELVAQAMERSPGYANHSDTVLKMLTTVLTAELRPGLRLSGLQPGSWVPEMEFFFPLKSIDPKLLAGYFKTHGIATPVNLERMAERLNFQRVRGMLLGFIDLLFCHDGVYYLLDWKSNHLGNQPEQYTPDSLAREMERKLYPLQYLIYTVAVNRYLERRVAGYRYEEHFGGVLYLFLRGIDHAHPANGIYFDKPDAALVQALTHGFIDSGEA